MHHLDLVNTVIPFQQNARFGQFFFFFIQIVFKINKGLQQDQGCINRIYNLHVGPYILTALIQGIFLEFSLYNIYVQWSK